MLDRGHLEKPMLFLVGWVTSSWANRWEKFPASPPSTELCISNWLLQSIRATEKHLKALQVEGASWGFMKAIKLLLPNSWFSFFLFLLAGNVRNDRQKSRFGPHPVSCVLILQHPKEMESSVWLLMQCWYYQKGFSLSCSSESLPFQASPEFRGLIINLSQSLYRKRWSVWRHCHRIQTWPNITMKNQRVVKRSKTAIVFGSKC